MVGRLASDLRQTSRKTTVLLLHPGPGPSPAGDGRAGRVFCFYPKASTKSRAKSGVVFGSQVTLEAYS